MTQRTRFISLITAVLLTLFCFAGCLGERASVGSVGDITISGDDFYFNILNYMLSVQANNSDSENKITYKNIKNQKADGERTYEEYFQDVSLNYVAQQAVINAMYDEMELVWDDAAQKEYEDALNSYYSQIDGGKEEMKRRLESFNINISSLENSYKTEFKLEQITQALYGEEGKTPITAQAAKDDFVKEHARVKNILIPTVNLTDLSPLPEAELAAAKAQYDECMAKINALNDNDEAGFGELLKKYNKDTGMDSNTDGYIVADDGQFVPEFTEASLNLKVGGYTSCESDYGYHIIMRLPIRDDDIISQNGSVESYISSYRSSKVIEDVSARISKDGLKRNESAIKKITKEAEGKLSV